MFGTAATQRGRAVQPAFMMSSKSSAVVDGSTVTSLSSGGGGATAVFQSEITSAIEGEPSNANTSAAPAAAERDEVMMSSPVFSVPRIERQRAERNSEANHLAPLPSGERSRA